MNVEDDVTEQISDQIPESVVIDLAAAMAKAVDAAKADNGEVDWFEAAYNLLTAAEENIRAAEEEFEDDISEEV